MIPIVSKVVKPSLGNIIPSNIIKILFMRLFYFLVNEINKKKRSVYVQCKVNLLFFNLACLSQSHLNSQV